MPDGSTLAQALNQQAQHEPSRKSRKQKTAKADRWEQSFKLIRQHPASQTEQTELDYLYRVGRERRRRFLNDKLLRDMAGPLTAREMEGLFKPAPFGESNYTTPLQEVLQPDNATIWDLFRNIDFDKQNRLLQVSLTATQHNGIAPAHSHTLRYTTNVLPKCTASPAVEMGRQAQAAGPAAYQQLIRSTAR